MGEDNLPVVNIDKCTGCGTCERICPKGIITLSSYSRRIQHEYTTDECSAPCQRSCPAGIDIPGYINKISHGDYLGAIRLIKESNPLPLICGRICVHPCEYECRRNLVDDPVAINNLKRFATDYEMNSGVHAHNPRAPETGKRVAVIGGGAEGLTAAYLINRLGHDSAIYESSSVLGGILRTGLPPNRLPRNVLDWETEGILDAGVQAFMNKRLGRDINIESLLKEEYSAVVIATGGWDTRLSSGELDDGPVESLPGVQLLIDFLLDNQSGGKPSPGKDIVILGGGRAALEAAGACLKNGAGGVSIVLRATRDQAAFSEEDILRAEEQGIRFYFQSAVTKLAGEGNRLTGVEVAGLTEAGKEAGERELIQTDTLLTGSGRFPELVYVPIRDTEESEARGPVRWETLFPYPGPFAEQDIGIFRPGEEASDYKAVVEAIGAGRRVAASIQRYLDEYGP